MKRISAILMMVCFAICSAQARQVPERKFERIRALKVSYITEQLALTPEQAEKFWPVYHQAEGELKAIRQKYRSSAQAGSGPMSDDAARRYVDDNLDYQSEMLALKKRYKDRFLKVITPQQLATLYESEKNFRKMLLQKVAERKGGRRGQTNGQQLPPEE